MTFWAQELDFIRFLTGLAYVLVGAACLFRVKPTEIDPPFLGRDFGWFAVLLGATWGLAMLEPGAASSSRHPLLVVRLLTLLCALAFLWRHVRADYLRQLKREHQRGARSWWLLCIVPPFAASLHPAAADWVLAACQTAAVPIFWAGAVTLGTDIRNNPSRLGRIALRLATSALIGTAVASCLGAWGGIPWPLEWGTTRFSQENSLPFDLANSVLAIVFLICLEIYRRAVARHADIGERWHQNGLGILSAVALLAATGWLATERAGTREVQRQQEALISLTRFAMAGIDPHDLATLTGTRNDLARPEYQRLRQHMSHICSQDPRVRNFYFYGTRDGVSINYVFSSAIPKDDRQIGPGAEFMDTDDQEERFFNGEWPNTVFPPYRDQWGTWVTAVVPAITDTKSGKVLLAAGLDVEASEWRQQTHAARLPVVLVVALLCLLLIGFQIYMGRVYNLAEQIARSEQWHRSLFEKMVDGLLLLQAAPDGNEWVALTANPAFERMTGLPFASLRDRSLTTISRLLNSSWQKDAHRVIHTQQPLHVETELPSTGCILSVNLFQPAPNQLALLLTDITEQRKAELARKTSEERLRLALDAVNDAIWDWNMESDVLYLSPRFYSTLGYEEGEFPPTFAAWLSLLAPEDVTTARETTLGLMKDLGRHGFDLEYRMRTKTGSFRWVLCRGRVIERANGGKPRRLTGTIIDITERKQTEEVLRERGALSMATAEIQQNLTRERQLNEMKTRFISMVSHEFRTPLTVIRSSLQILNDYDDRLSGADKVKHRNYIQNAVSSMITLLEDVLTISRDDVGKFLLEPHPHNPVQLCEAVCELHRLSAPKRVITLSAGPGTGIPLQLDERLLRPVVDNLLGNALKYSPEGGNVDCSIAYTPSKGTADGGILEIRVADRGIGVPENEREHLFGPFWRASNTAGMTGTGLGLHIVKRFCTRMGGTITHENRLEGGSVFIVRIPTLPSAPASATTKGP